MRSFGSDNHSGVHPDILKAIETANKDHNIAYGDDPYTKRILEKFREMFGSGSDTYLVFSGTGANVLALRTLTRPYYAIICAETAHINENECGAPEFHTGCKLLAIATPDGKLTPELVKTKLHGLGSQHRNQPKVISVTQPTELGTLYTVREIRDLAELAHANDMYIHVDGARFGNAVAALGVTPYEMITAAGVDALSFGGTKNGLMMGEAVVFTDGRLSGGAVFERKQLMQLASKMRFLAAQFEAYLNDDLWLKMAGHSNSIAKYMYGKLDGISGIRITQKVEANGLFVEIPREAAMRLREHYYFNITPGDPCLARWMCSYDTTEEDIDGFACQLREALCL